MHKTTKTRMIYNPFVLKLIHAKLHYMDRLIVAYLPEAAREKHDALHHIVARGDYHMDLVLRDIVSADACSESAKYPLDIYLVNFEYFMWRMCGFYDPPPPPSSPSPPRTKVAVICDFPCEYIMRQHVETAHKQDLMRRLTRRFLYSVYFADKQPHGDDEQRRLRDRVTLLFNIKTMIEKEIGPLQKGSSSSSGEYTLHFDRAACAALHYIYMINEFMSDRVHMFDKNRRNIVKFTNQQSVFMHGQDDAYQNIRDYIAGHTDRLEEGPIDDTVGLAGGDGSLLMQSYAEDFVFLTHLRTKLIETLVNYMYGWGVTDRYTLMDCHQHHCHYLRTQAPSRTHEPYSDRKFSHFAGYDTDAHLPPPVFLPLAGNEKFYAAIGHEMLFTMRCDARHGETRCGDSDRTNEDTTHCTLCSYRYLRSRIVSDFSEKCHAYRYNTPTTHTQERESEHDRTRLDKYLMHAVMELVDPFQGHLFRVLYRLTLLLYHSALLIEETEVRQDTRYDLFRMISLNHTHEHVTRQKFERDIEQKLCDIIHYCKQQQQQQQQQQRKQPQSSDLQHLRSQLGDFRVRLINNDDGDERLHAIDLTIAANNTRIDSMLSGAITLTPGQISHTSDTGDDDDTTLASSTTTTTTTITQPIQAVETVDFMRESESVRRLAFDMELLMQIITNVSSQHETVKKYERSLCTIVKPETLVLHSKMMLYLHKAYIYYTRQLCILMSHGK